MHKEQDLERYCRPIGDRSLVKRGLHVEEALWKEPSPVRVSVWPGWDRSCPIAGPSGGPIQKETAQECHTRRSTATSPIARLSRLARFVLEFQWRRGESEWDAECLGELQLASSPASWRIFWALLPLQLPAQLQCTSHALNGQQVATLGTPISLR